MILSGRVWRLGDAVGATDLLAARYDKQGMSRLWAECATHILEDLLPAFASAVRPGDILVAGQGFGAGHAHYYTAAIMGSRTAGVAGFFTESISGLFQRAAIDLGMPAWAFPGLAALVAQGDQLELDLGRGSARNVTAGTSMALKPVSQIILDILAAGGSEPWALGRVGADRQSA